ncbi:acyl-CoA synthetase (AMP-forming)/AMP-acid ligase II [Actinoplanes campanulatus]|uniref:Acyl-CoA synthetase (AMP-forming)/AMP-acid ligase II n=1 Tax=Actinoplanes campanulatus TaxID=113559 RepID=A0A7W5ADF5_9ACTN|nr:fatty acid CoA ligase family protein [Actinoplanes campanulatus]MBB3094057.1 acyl-CoA synthetase (AMP-forming)/AMP-acid ligase II [Actinoplanes campanulatus]GGN33068.1 peptide synthase [Actinoplanes campanulatus]GID38244.1 peptide synthase [Actinoplanes campanulatus]
MATSTVAGVAARLAAHAGDLGTRDAVIRPGHGRLTFRELDEQSDTYAAGLHALGIGKGTKTVLMLRPGLELFPVLFGLLKLGAVPVVVDPGMGVRRMLHCYRSAGADAFIGIGAAHVVRLLNRRAFAGTRILVTAGRRWGWGGTTLRALATHRSPAPTVPPDAGDLLMIGFTTGSTGPAKGVESTHGALEATVEQVIAAHGQSADDVALVTSPMFGVLHLLIGSTCVLAPIDPARVGAAAPATIADTIEEYGVTTMFASPALLGPFGRYLRDTGRRLPSLRTLVSGGAPVPDRLVPLLHRHDLRFHTTYGATEALPIASIEAREILRDAGAGSRAGAGTCVGRPVDGIEVRVVHITDEPMPVWREDLRTAPGEIGEITIAGPTVSPRYHRLPEADAAAKIADGDRRWHRTGDLGWIDDQGRIWFCGRKSQRVGDLHTVQCEGVFDAHPDVHRTALVEADGRPVVCVEAGPGVADHDRLRRELHELAQSQPMTKTLDTFVFHPSFPVDIRHNAKINREYLSRWAAHRLRPNRRRDLAPRLLPLAGWAFLGYGLLGPMPHPALWALWWIDAFLSIVVHLMQLPVVLPRARRAGITRARAAAMTVVFGATWWRGLP